MDLDEIVIDIRKQLERTHEARESALKLSRELIQISSRAIRAMHRHEFENAIDYLANARQASEKLRSFYHTTPEIYYAGYVHDSQKEFVEASAVYAIVTNSLLPTAEELQVEPAAYLNGLAEAGSECRRFVLDLMRSGTLDEAENVMARMDAIYSELITVDFPDAITGGLRRTTDAFRAVLERTRGDITLTGQQAVLLKALIDLRKSAAD